MEEMSFRDLHWLLDIIQSADIGILVIDKNFNIEIYNRFMQVHSGINAETAIGNSVFQLFPYLDDEWFRRRVMSVFELGIPVYTTFEQRDSVFDFSLKLPIHHEVDRMFQNTTFVPLRSTQDRVEKVGVVVYDVTDTALNRRKLLQAKNEMQCLSRTDKLTALWNRGYWEERLVEEFRGTSQLLIVSHQQQTMEGADVLYGVTMEPGGSSKVISKRLTEAQLSLDAVS